jgi:SET domain-containing protein
MSILFKSDKIYIKKSEKHGWGVFTNSIIKIDEIIEECPYVEIFGDIDYNLLKYTFMFEDSSVHFFFSCGICSCLNSSINPNVSYSIDVDRGMITFKSIKDILKDTELFLNYGFD